MFQLHTSFQEHNMCNSYKSSAVSISNPVQSQFHLYIQLLSIGFSMHGQLFRLVEYRRSSATSAVDHQV